MAEDTFAGMKKEEQREPSVPMTAKEWIAQLRDYRGLKCRRGILEGELHEAELEYDDERIGECRSAIAALDADLARLERLADTYGPSDTKAPASARNRHSAAAAISSACRWKRPPS